MTHDGPGPAVATNILAATDLPITVGPEPGAWRAETDSDRMAGVAPALLAIALPFLLLLMNDSWILTYPSTIDGWVYFGYFENPRTYLQAFAGTYYGTRLSWILPGAALHQLFPDFAANVILHLLVYCAGVLAVLWTVGRAAGQRAALMAAVMLGTYSYYLFSTGWYYVDGAGIVYYAAAVAALTAAARSRWRRPALAAGGVAFAGAVHSNILWLALALPFAVYAWQVCRPTRRGFILDALALAAGAAGCTVLLGAISVALGSDFLFFRPSFSFATSALAQPSPFHSPGWVLTGRWLVFPVVALVCALIWRWRAGGAPASQRLVEHYFLSCLMFIGLEAIGRPALEVPFSASFLIPRMALATGVMLSGPLARLTVREFGRLTAVALVAGVGVYCWPIAGALQKMLWPVPLFVLALMLTSALLVMWRPRLIALATLVVAAAVSNIAIADGSAFDFSGLPTRADSFRAILKGSDAVDELDPKAGALFWYSEGSRLGTVYEAVASTRLWGYRLAGTRFPSLWNPIIQKDSIPKDGARVFILSEDPAALATAARTLRPLKLRPSAIADRVIEDGGIRFHLLLTELVAVTP